MARLDPTLSVESIDGTEQITCSDCNEVICPAGENYKLHALCDVRPLQEAGPLVNDPAEYVDDDLEFRQFFCPGCGTLLENEVVLAELEPIHDKELK